MSHTRHLGAEPKMSDPVDTFEQTSKTD